MSPVRLLTVLAVLGTLAGCAADRLVQSPAALAADPTRRAWMAPKIETALPSVKCAKPWIRRDLLTYLYQGQESQIYTEISCRGDVVDIRTILPLGAVPLVDITDNGQVLSAERRTELAADLSPSQLAADLYFALLPAQAWSSVLPEGWHVRGTGDRRELAGPDGDPYVTVFYSAQCAGRCPERLEHHGFGYSVSFFTFDCPEAGPRS